MQIQALFLPIPLRDYHATILLVASGVAMSLVFALEHKRQDLLFLIKKVGYRQQPANKPVLLSARRPHLLRLPLQSFPSIHTIAQQE